MSNGTLDVHLEPVAGEIEPRIILLLQVDDYADAFRVHLSNAEARRLAEALLELANRQTLIGHSGEN